jgi:hypothetical protein
MLLKQSEELGKIVNIGATVFHVGKGVGSSQCNDQPDQLSYLN